MLCTRYSASPTSCTHLLIAIVALGDEVEQDVDNPEEELPRLGVGRQRVLVDRVQGCKKEGISRGLCSSTVLRRRKQFSLCALIPPLYYSSSGTSIRRKLDGDTSPITRIPRFCVVWAVGQINCALFRGAGFSWLASADVVSTPTYTLTSNWETFSDVILYM